MSLEDTLRMMRETAPDPHLWPWRPTIVRCRECRYRQEYPGGLMCARLPFRYETSSDDFCSQGKMEADK